MRIYSMTATFGKLSHATLTLEPGMNIIQAPNEWGKSTWCAFLVAMLYGIDTRERTKTGTLADKEHYAPWSGEPMSGRIALCWNGRNITIERKNKGRSIFGAFSAFETDTGIAVPELTGDNCGQKLLGVEKSVFLRAGFLRLTDLPVTQDESLRRRLNALVTTGDESGSADDLAQKLKDIKNRCRFNRSGLLPQAEAGQKVLQENLSQLDGLQQQVQNSLQRVEELKVHKTALQNHRQALRYEAGREQLRQRETLLEKEEAARQRAQQLEAQCAQLAEQSVLRQQLYRLQQLKEQKEALQMELQMRPDAPVMPQVSAPFRGADPATAQSCAAEDAAEYEKLLAGVKKPSPVLWLLGAGLLVAGIILALAVQPLPGIITACAGLVFAVAGLVLQNNRNSQNLNLQNRAQLLAQRYQPLEVGNWQQAAKAFCDAQQAYERQMEQFRAENGGLLQRQQSLARQQAELMGDMPIARFEEMLRTDLQTHADYNDALRVCNQLKDMLAAVTSGSVQVQPPEAPDTLQHSLPETERMLSDTEQELRATERRIAQSQGYMQSLGSREMLERQLALGQARIEKLEKIYRAAEFAQENLRQARQALQRRFAPRLSKRAQELFTRLTGGRYDRLSLMEDLSLHTGAQGEDILHNALWRSEGTVDQLYLALRLAVAQELTPDAPLVLDDALVRCDDTRLQAALEILQEMSEEKQVILFTCQSREREWSKGE